MSLSLRDQLLKAGLVNEKQVKQAERSQKKQQRLVQKNQAQADESSQQAALQAQAEKQARDQALNLEQKEKAEKKAIKAQIKQLIEGSRLPKLDSDDYFNFADRGKVKRIAVNDMMRDKLSRGTLAIVSHAGAYEIIPRDVALKIQERDEQRIVLLSAANEKVENDADDPYAAYQIPDDLMW